MRNETLQKIQQGNIKSIAHIISLIENDAASCADLLRSLPYSEKKIIGITGPPGAGKSTLIDCLINELIAQQKKVGVICIDPSSPFTRGALLGDRIRMNAWFNNPNVFIRSLASRGNMHGLHPKIIEITDVLKTAPFDHIIVETVGAGQTETEIAALADTTVVVLVTESGDEIQNMKSGLMEIGDIFVVNKADSDQADLFAKNLQSMLALSSNQKQKNAPVLKTIATKKNGAQELLTIIDKHANNKTGTGEKIQLLAEKAYALIKQQRMKDISLQMLTEKIRKLTDSNEFNLYVFIEEFIS